MEHAATELYAYMSIKGTQKRFGAKAVAPLALHSHHLPLETGEQGRCVTEETRRAVLTGAILALLGGAAPGNKEKKDAVRKKT